MLLSPIFLALGAVATSVLNAQGRFAAAAIAPIVYNLAIIGGARCSWPRRSASPGWRSASSPGSLGHLLVQLPAVRAARVPLRAAHRPRRPGRRARRSR